MIIKTFDRYKKKFYGINFFMHILEDTENEKDEPSRYNGSDKMATSMDSGIE